MAPPWPVPVQIPDLLKWSLLTVGSVSALGLGALYILQGHLIYVPKIPGVTNDLLYLPDRFNLAFEDVWLTAADNIRLHAWFMWPSEWAGQEGGAAAQLRRRPVVLFFQENAGNMSWRLPFLTMLARSLNCSVFAPSYRGYGLSAGKPSEPGLKLDAAAALDHLLQDRQDIDRDSIIVFGRSLGGAVAIDLLASRGHEVRGAIIENTFSSIQDVAPSVMPLLRPFIGPRRPLNFLIRNRWESIKQIRKAAEVPMLLLSSLKDEMLPPAQMRQLFDAVKEAGSMSAVWTEFPNGNHMESFDICRAQYWPAVQSFVKTLFTAASGKQTAAAVKDSASRAAVET